MDPQRTYTYTYTSGDADFEIYYKASGHLHATGYKPAD